VATRFTLGQVNQSIQALVPSFRRSLIRRFFIPPHPRSPCSPSRQHGIPCHTSERSLKPGNATPHWYVFPATISGNQITFNITDGGAGDSDARAGFIADPGGPGVPAGPVGAGGVTGVPTLSEWGLLLLVGLMVLLGVRGSRGRRG
jgi:hypothetical protein